MIARLLTTLRNRRYLREARLEDERRLKVLGALAAQPPDGYGWLFLADIADITGLKNDASLLALAHDLADEGFVEVRHARGEVVFPDTPRRRPRSLFRLAPRGGRP